MADKQISGLDVGTPEETDEMVVQKTGGGLNVKYTVETLLGVLRAVGELHSNADHTMAGVTTTPTPLVGFDASDIAIGITTTLTPDSGSNRGSFTADKDGTYRITVNIECESTTNDNIDIILNIDGVPTEFKAGINLSNAAIDSGSAGINAMIPLVTNNVVEIYLNCDGTTMDILIDSLTFTAQKVAG